MNDGVQGIFATYTGNYGEKGLERYALKILANELANCIVDYWVSLPMHYKTSVTSDGKQEHRVLIHIVSDEFFGRIQHNETLLSSRLCKITQGGTEMNTERFNEIIRDQISMCKDILIEKAKEYATEDRLHNFKVAARLQGISETEALAGMMAKHTVSVYDMCCDGERHPLATWNEKITDSINYLLLLSAVIRVPSSVNNQRMSRN